MSKDNYKIYLLYTLLAIIILYTSYALVKAASRNTSGQSSPSDSVVNIVCSIPDNGQTKRHISSSGVVFSENGLILTNAHVAIHIFLQDYTDLDVDCSARAPEFGSTTLPLSMIYISPTWTDRHRGEIHGALNPDTGESDFAILRIHLPEKTKLKDYKISSLNLTPLINRSLFAFTKGGSDNLKLGEKLLLVAYPVGETMIYSPNTPIETENLNINNLQEYEYSSKNPPSNNRSIQIIGPKLIKYEDFQSDSSMPTDQNYTDAEKHPDLITTDLGKIGRSGSSGGAMINAKNELVGLITNIIRPPEEDGSMKFGTFARGITIQHIEDELRRQADFDLYELSQSKSVSRENSLKYLFESEYSARVKANLLGN